MFIPGPRRANTAPHSAVEACSEVGLLLASLLEFVEELSCAAWAATCGRWWFVFAAAMRASGRAVYKNRRRQPWSR